MPAVRGFAVFTEFETSSINESRDVAGMDGRVASQGGDKVSREIHGTLCSGVSERLSNPRGNRLRDL